MAISPGTNYSNILIPTGHAVVERFELLGTRTLRLDSRPKFAFQIVVKASLSAGMKRRQNQKRIPIPLPEHAFDSAGMLTKSPPAFARIRNELGLITLPIQILNLQTEPTMKIIN
jgi:hypothetical protein